MNRRLVVTIRYRVLLFAWAAVLACMSGGCAGDANGDPAQDPVELQAAAVPACDTSNYHGGIFYVCTGSTKNEERCNDSGGVKTQFAGCLLDAGAGKQPILCVETCPPCPEK